MNNKEPLIYEFQTQLGNRYVYDACTNYTYPVNEIDIDIINNYYKIKNGDSKENQSKNLKERESITG